MQHDLFISHASEDKEALVRPLAEALTLLGLGVWYDEYSLSAGDSLSASLDKGLNESSYGAVILSPSFFAKPWPEYEFRSLVALEAGRSKRIIPVWFNVDREDVLKFSPHLADKVAIAAAGKNPTRIAIEIMRVASPEKFSKLARAMAARRSMLSKVERVDIRELTQSPLRGPLTQEQLRRLRLVHEATFDVYPVSWEQMVANFQRDHPEFREREIRSWERIAGTYSATRRQYALGDTEREQLFGLLMRASLGMLEEVDRDVPAWVVHALADFGEKLPNARE
ncbi:toll/interleukin-1 receptor domain-containing protein [Streptomyces sp. NPDC094466]|uniref:toll/interleukin-1 receptor domain-containing protein n=1 Tax=Streptomyces sp. NPDC094466 TaxID=3366065 RepID=UPI0037F595D6